MRRVAIVGAGLAGLAAAYELSKASSCLQIVLYEKNDSLDGHSRTISVNGTELDLRFTCFHQISCQNMIESYGELQMETEAIDMSFSLSLDGKNYEWGSRNGLSSFFIWKHYIMNPFAWLMLKEIFKFKNEAIRYLKEHDENPGMDRTETLELYLKSRGYSQQFQNAFVMPICDSIWPCASNVMSFSAYSVLSFYDNNHLLEVHTQVQQPTSKCVSQNYINKIKEELEIRCCQIKLGCEVQSVSKTVKGCSVTTTGFSEEFYDECILTIRAPDALRILGKETTYDESRILGAFQYVNSDAYLHCDASFMPQNPSAWSARNFLEQNKSNYLTYWLNVLQNPEPAGQTLFVTLNPPSVPMNTMFKWTTSYSLPTMAASRSSLELESIQGKRGIWFCGSYQGFGYQEDALKAGLLVAHKIHGKDLNLLKLTRHMTPSLMEAGARLVVIKFLERFISKGCLILLENGKTSSFGEIRPCYLKSVIKVRSTLFYSKIATGADIGLAEAYINGYFSFVDPKGLFNFILLLIANRELCYASNSKKNKRWWMPFLLTTGLSTAKYMLRHISRKNKLSQTADNVSQHYDVSNDFFSLILDERMQYSCPIFKDAKKNLGDAQLQKISALIDKANIDARHEILEIGCGWGGFAIEAVKQTGCKYTGITLSIEQLHFAKRRVEEAGLQENVTLLMCDYRQIPFSRQYDRIISCEMIEAVGHEYMEEFFSCCEKLLAKDGLFVLQFSSIPDQRYDEQRRYPGFISEHIFPGGCLPSLNRVISAMTSSSNLCVEHLENISIHYSEALMQWKTKLMENKRELLALGFDERFIRKWEYYFVYCAAGFKSRIIGNYQIVFSRPGNNNAFKDPCKGISSVGA